MIGIVILGSVRDAQWDFKLLYRVVGKTILEHTITLASDVEAAHSIIACLDYKDTSSVTGSAFTTSAVSKDFALNDSRIKMMFSDKGDWIGKTYEACIKFGLTNVCVISADNPLIPPWLIKEVIMRHVDTGRVVKTQGYPIGIRAEAYTFPQIANLYRYRDFDDDKKKYMDSLAVETISNTNVGQYYIYDKITDLKFDSKEKLPMFDALLTDIGRGEELGDLLKEWHEQEKPIQKP